MLDDRIDEFSELIREKYDIDEVGDPSSVTEVCLSFLTSFRPFDIRVPGYRDCCWSSLS